MDIKDYISQLFKNDFSQIVAVLSKQIGIQHLETIEDLVSETFLQATETWKEGNIPKNAAGWLYTVAKHKVYKHFNRNRIFTDKVIPGFLAAGETEDEPASDLFSDEYIKDSQLQMIFAICNPVIVTEAQIGLALRILGGFSIEEIAEAFFTNKETINKRLFRAKEKLRTAKVKMEIPDKYEMNNRLDTVLSVVYLFFNEGYYSLSQNQILRKDLCAEALRLGVMLTENERTDLPKTNALVALMCYHASRFTARQSVDNSPILYKDQDRKLWDKELIGRGDYYLSRSARGKEITNYHLEARIAYCHSEQTEANEKWQTILRLYDQLLRINYSPTIALNRIYALYRVNGAKAALLEIEKFKLVSNHFYYTLLGELYSAIDVDKAIASYQKARVLAKSQHEKQILSDKIKNL